MKFTILKDHFVEAISHVSKAVSSKTTIPILTGIKLELTSTDLILTASDTDISIRCQIPFHEEDKEIIQMDRIGSVVLPARILGDIVRKLPESIVHIETEERWATTIKAGKSQFNLNGFDPEEFPKLPQLAEEQIFSVPSHLLRSMIKQTVFAVSTTESRPVLTGVLWTLSQGKFKFVATDSHRLATREAMVEGRDDLSFSNIVVPGKSLVELNKILNDSDQWVDIVVTENQILVKIKDLLFYSRLLSGTYPDTSRIIPQNHKTQLTLSSKLFMDAIDRASLLNKDGKGNLVKLTTLGKQIEISSNIPEIGKVTEMIETSAILGEELRISFNAKYMIEAIRAVDAEEITIDFTGAMSPFVIKPVDSQWMLHLILPVRTY